LFAKQPANHNHNVGTVHMQNMAPMHSQNMHQINMNHQIIEAYHTKKNSDQCITNNNSKQNHQSIQPQQVRPVAIAFTPALLQGALSKLKKITEETEPVHVPIENDQITKQINNLKHVETKKVDIIDIFKKEHKEKIKKDFSLIQKINSNLSVIFETTNENILTGLQILKKINR
jgi:hypothetical protein